MSMVLHLAVSDLKPQQYTPCVYHDIPKSMIERGRHHFLVHDDVLWQHPECQTAGLLAG